MLSDYCHNCICIVINKISTIYKYFKMKKVIFALVVLGLSFASTSCQKKGTVVVDVDEPTVLNDLNDSLNWAMGFSVAQNIASTGIAIDRDVLFKAICVTLDSKQQPMTQTQTFEMLQKLEQQAFANKSTVEQSKLEETRAFEAEYFSKLQKDNPNVKKSDKGFYYEVLKEGNGRQGAEGLVAVFDYKGSFTNGQVFDQTYGNRPPLTYVISDNVIPGLFEGLCMMKAGSKYRFYFPSEMAFGARGTDGVPPYSTMVYEVELYEVRD